MFKFVHVPKTGGETIITLLGLPKIHIKAIDIPDISNYYSFCFVRNPYSKLYSWYHHLRKHLIFDVLEMTTNELNNQTPCYHLLKLGERMEPRIHRELAEKLPFNEWANIILTDKQYKEPYWGPCGNQYDFIYDNNDKKLVNDIFKFENYNEDIITLFKKLNKDNLIDKVNITNFNFYGTPWRDAYTSHTKRLTYQYFAKDFTTFGYDP